MVFGAHGFQIIRHADLHAENWKNGGGITRQISADHDGDHLFWRLSLADVTADGAFSVFPGLTRILTVVQGAGMDLLGQDQNLQADPLTPLRFDGALPLDGRLRSGAVVNLNLIYDAGRYAAKVRPVQGPRTISFSDPAALHILHVVSGVVDLDPVTSLQHGDTVILPVGQAPDLLHVSGSAVLLALTDQSDANNPDIAAR